MNNNEYLISIGERMSEIRRAHNLTQEELAEKLDISVKHVSHTERGLSSLSLKNMMEFCRIFDCSLDYIIFGNQNNSPLSKIPDKIAEILYTGNEKEINRLNRYLEMYIELTEKQD
ncbi:MAG: helix-turn-helix transcriptional regulator [Lachnospiraceae bacterium]|nr:helix-turn-helix transcriptional regulator [Lachnospiraceae bacterium]